MSFLAFSTSPYLHNHPPWREDHWIYGSTMLGLKDGGWIDSCGVGKVEHGTVWTGRKATQHALDLLLSSWENVTVMWTKSIWGGAKPYLPYIFCCVLFERSTLILIFFFFFHVGRTPLTESLPPLVVSLQVGNLGLLFMLLFFIFAALGVELFGDLSKDTLQYACRQMRQRFTYILPSQTMHAPSISNSPLCVETPRSLI